jgi:excisionase family DNA binding protein
MSLTEFAAYAGICRTLVYEQIKSGRLKARRVTRRRVVILKEDAEDFMRSLPVVNLAEAA